VKIQTIIRLHGETGMVWTNFSIETLKWREVNGD
jgi:hypothetical protein